MAGIKHRSLHRRKEIRFTFSIDSTATNLLTRRLMKQTSNSGRDIFLLSTASRPGLESTQPPVQSVPEPCSKEIKLPGLEASYHRVEQECFQQYLHCATRLKGAVGRLTTSLIVKDPFYMDSGGTW